MSNNQNAIMSMPTSSLAMPKEASPYQKRRKDKKITAGTSSSVSERRDEQLKTKKAGIRTPMPTQISDKASKSPSKIQ